MSEVYFFTCLDREGQRKGQGGRPLKEGLFLFFQFKGRPQEE